MIKAIIFDYGGVLTHESAWDPVVIKYMNGSIQKAEPIINEAVGVWLKARIGDCDSRKFWEVIANKTNTSPEKVKKDILDLFAVNSDVINLLSELKNKYRLVILSNQIEDWLESVIEQEKFTEIFKVIIGSYHAKLAKPDTKIFEYALDKLKLNSNECLFIDDTEKNVLAAKSLGMFGITFRNYEQLLVELKRLGVN